MGASSGARALVLLLAAVGLTAGGFVLGRRLSQQGAATVPPTPSSPAAPVPRVDASVTTPAAGTPERRTAGLAAEASGPAPEPVPGPPAGRRAAPSARGGKPRTGSAPLVPGPQPAPREPEPIRALPEPPAGHGFAAGLTRIGTTRSSGAPLNGFDPSAVALKRAPRSEGSIEFEVTPSQLTPGQPYAVKVYLRNHGERPIQVKNLTIASELNGHNSRSSLSPRSKQVAPSLVGLLAELPGIWKEGVSSWSMEVEVLTSAGDTYSNRVAWK